MTDQNPDASDAEQVADNDNGVSAPSYGGLKVAVFALAGILFLGLIFIIIMIVYQANRLGETPVGRNEQVEFVDRSQPLAPVPPFGARQLPAPEGGELNDIVVGAGSLVLYYRTASGPDMIQIVDLRTGELRGTLTLDEAQ